MADDLLSGLPVGRLALLRRIGEVAAAAGSEALLVGGTVRDLLLQRETGDVDVVIRPDAFRLAERLRRDEGGGLRRHPAFMTVTWSLPTGERVDLATARSETYPQPGALPEVSPDSITSDLRRRDFSIHALAIRLEPDRFGELVDPVGGLQDLTSGLLRTIHPGSFIDDPTRVLRAARYAGRLDFKLEPETESSARRAVDSGALASLSSDRLSAEMDRCLMEPSWIATVNELERLGVLRWLHPGLRSDPALLRSTDSLLRELHEEQGVDACALPVRRAALLHPLGLPEAVTTGRRRLSLTPEQARALEAAIRLAGETDWPPGPEPPRPSQIYRRLHEEPLTAILLKMAVSQEVSRFPTDTYLRVLRHVRLAINGDDLLAAGATAGPVLGAALRNTLEARLDGLIAGKAEELDFALLTIRAARANRQPNTDSERSR